MNFEFVRWKKYEKQIQKLEGWINKDKLNFENNYQEITTVGLNVSETKEWLTVAYSLCKDEYLYPIQICKANIIERHSFNTEKQTITDKVLSKEQEEYAKKDVQLSNKVLDLDNFIKDYDTLSTTQLANKYAISINKTMEIIQELKGSGQLKEKRSLTFSKQENSMVTPFYDTDGTPLDKSLYIYKIKDREISWDHLPYYFMWYTPEKQNLLNNFVEDYNKYTQKELFKLYPKLNTVGVLDLIHTLIDLGIVEEHGKHWRTKKGLIIKQSKVKSTKSNKLTKEQEQFIIDNYERYTQIEFAEYFSVKKHLVGEKINKLVKKGIVPKHERGWTRYSEEYKRFHNISHVEKGSKKETKKEEFVLTQDQQDNFIKYYNMGIKMTDIASYIHIPYSKTTGIIKALVSEGKIPNRAFILGQYVFYWTEEELAKKKEEIRSQLKPKIEVKDREPEKLKMSRKEVQELLPKKIIGNENDEFIYSIPGTLGGVLKLDPPVNKKEFIADSKILDTKELVKKYGKPVFVIESLLKDLTRKRTIKYLVDKNTGYKWVFKTPLLIEEYLNDKNTMTFEQLRSKYKLSPKVFGMLNSFINKV